MTAKDRSVVQIIWDFFCSLKLTIVVLILLAVTSIIGTVLPQTATPQENLQRFGEAKYRLFEALDFFDMYHSWWFLTLLGLFSINLVACSIKRLPRVLKTVREPVLVAEDSLFRTLSNVEEHLVKGEMPAWRDKLAGFLEQHFAKPIITEQDGQIHLYAHKGAYSRFGVYVTHLSILIIFIGAIMGNIWGYKAYVNIVEGTEATQVWPRGKNQPIELGFAVRCDAFSVSYYGNSTRPKEFKSLLTVTDAGQVVYDKRPVIVNDPLSYKGITFYQSSYGPAGDPVFSFRVRPRAGGETQQLTLRQGQRVALAGGASFRVVDFTPSFQTFGPAARLEVTPETGSGKRPYSFVVLQKFPEFDAQRGGEYVFSLVDAQQRYYTGLQVAKDPGVWVVWLGCTLMVVGTMVAFFLSHRRIWIRLQEVDGKLGIKLGGTAHRNQPAFEIFFDGLKKDLQHELLA